MRRKPALLLTLAAVVGCGTGGPEAVIEDTVPVSGVATYQGKPLEGYQVSFSTPDARTAVGQIDAEGRFTLGTNATGDGAPVGTHKVWFSYAPVVESIPGREDEVVIPPAKVKLPAKYTRQEMSDVTVDVPDDGLTDHKIELK